jgi:pimeloyl-ACP methyl ester carboxylesterase
MRETTKRKRNIGRRIICVMFFTSLALSNLPLFAQAPKMGQVAAKKPAAGKCSGAWTGNITYTRTQSMNETKTTQRVSNRGKDTRTMEMRYNYKASVAVLESPERNGTNIGKANIDHSFVSTDKTEAREENSCDQGKTWNVMFGEFESKSEARGQASGVEANVSVGVNDDGTYAVSVGIPPIQGILKGEEKASFSGQCKPKEGKTHTMPSTPTTIDGNSLTSDGRDRVDPRDPNSLSGSYTLSGSGLSETITWNLRKCGAPLRITDLQFEDMKFPNWNDWRAIVEQRGTIDGNLVKIKAKVLNESGETKYADVRFKETYKGDKWDGARPDADLKDDVIGVRVDANSEQTVELVWDSSGYAWFDDGRPRLLQRIKAELEENNKKVDEMTKNLKVAPKPLVLVHGLWSSWRAWESWQNILTTSHSYDWKAYPVGEKPEKGLMNTGGSFLSTQKTNSIGQNADELGKYIKYAQEDRNAWHVDIVAHSMGGLISRYHIAQQMVPNTPEDPRPKVSHLIMLGTPNLGSPCADVMNVAFEMLGENVEAVRQLRQDQVANFNRVNIARKGVKFSALAGNPLPTMCKEVVWNDGVVPVASAKWKIKDNAESKSLHTDLAGTSDFSSFVKPRLAIGPKGDHMPEAPDASQYTGIYTHSRNYGASFAADEIVPATVTAPFAKSVTLDAKRSIEIDVPVESAANFGVTFMADPKISVTLIDASGAIVGKNLAGSPESRGWFRSVFFDKPVTAGVWKLRLENTGDLEYRAVVTSWANMGR